MSGLLFVNAAQVVTCAGPARARRGREMGDVEPRFNCAVAVESGRIAAVGPTAALREVYSHFDEIDCTGCVLAPGLVDSHTHAIFGAHRAQEQEMRAAGLGYMDIARRGGGIHFSVRDLRQRSDSELRDLAIPRLLKLASYGATTVEVKSGYGLDTENELRVLRLIRSLQGILPIRLVPTWLGAHEIPLEMREKESGRAEYLDILRHEMLPLVRQENLADFADIFCEPGAFTVDESRVVLGDAIAAGLKVKIHADELQWSGGAELAAELGATSADHLAAISDAGVAALAGSDVVATLLPGTMLFLGLDSRAPARRLIEAGAAVALASDFNPGTSPGVNLPLILTLGEARLGMSAAECLVAVTVNGAAALGLQAEVGQLAPGFSADIAIFEGSDFRELPYWYGDRLCRGSWSSGRPCHPLELSGNF